MKKFFVLATIIVLLSGCATKPDLVVVEKEDVPVPMQYEGKDGYWLSKSRMMMFFEIAERYKTMINNKADKR